MALLRALAMALCCLAICQSQDISSIVDNAEDSVLSQANDTTEDVKNDIVGFFHNSRNKLYEAFYNLSGYLPLSIEYAESVGKECDILEYNKDYYTVVGLALSAGLVLIGVVFAFFGYRLMKIVLFFIGFIIGGSLTYFIFLAFASDHADENWVPYTAASLSLVVGILCGALTICIYYVGIFLAGASIGFLLTWFVLAAIDIPFFQTHIYVPVIGAVIGALVFGVLSLWIQKWFFMLGTSVLGSFMLCWGVDYYLELGSMVYYVLLFAEHRSRLEPCWYSWFMLPLYVTCAVSAFLIQAVLTGRKYDHRKEMKGICCGVCKKKKASNESRGYMELTTKDNQ